MNPIARFTVYATAALSLAACQTTEKATPPSNTERTAPARWGEASGSESPGNWIESFGSPKLAALVDEADRNNLGLEAAYQRTRATEAAARISRALRLPSLGAAYRANRGQTPPNATETESHSIALSARWEIDLWNRLGQQSSASVAQYQASRYDYEAFRLSLDGQVAKSWFAAIEAKSQYDLANASADSFESKLESLERRYSRGLIDAFDLRLTRAQASASRSAAIQRRSQMDASIRSLEILLGRYPSAKLEASDALPGLPATPAAGIPSGLLARRPDVLAQKNRLLSALALEAAGNRNWLPTLTLTASDGTLSSRFADLLDSDFNVWSLAGEATAALFQSGRLAAQRDQLNANQLAQLAEYRSLVLQAFREVESTLRSEADLLDLERQTKISADENQLAEDQAWKLYERGLVDITAVLDAERRSFDTRSQLISIHNQRLQNRINLHIALGGSL